MTSSDVASLGPHPKDQPAAGDLQSLARPRDRRRTGASLRSRALRLLARREYTRAELRRRLLLAEESDVRKSLQQSGGPDPDALEPITDELLERIDSLLDDLERSHLLSDRRYAEVLVNSKGSRYGVARLSRTLATHGVGGRLAEDALAPLRATQRERALAIWKRRFSQPPSDLKERARQHRFLIGRGFDPATVAWVLKHGGNPPD